MILHHRMLLEPNDTTYYLLLPNMEGISSLIETYPSQFTRGIQALISNKKEMRDLTFKVEDGARLVPGTMFFGHQLLTHRDLRFNDDLLIMSAPGTGKSLEYLGFAESALTEYDRRRAGKTNDPYVSHINKVVIFVANKNLEADIKNQLICKASQGRYLVPEITEATTERAQRQAVNKVLKAAGYQIERYRAFNNFIRKEYPNPEDDDRLANDYADTLFIVDEAHNVSNEEADIDSDEDAEGSVYETFWRLFHVAKRCKRVLVSATPMINTPNELKSLLNLILPANMDMPIDFNYKNLTTIDRETWFPDLSSSQLNNMTRDEASVFFRGQIPAELDLRYITIERFEPYIRGRVTYVRALDTGAIPVAQGERSDEVILDNDTNEEFVSQIVTVNLTMSEHQSRGYFAEQDTKGIYSGVRQASLFVYPDGRTTGDKRGFKKYISKRGSKYTANAELKRYISSMDGLYYLSCKYGYIIETAKNSAGKAYCFFNFVDVGIITFSVCLEAQGYIRFNESESIFVSTEEDTAKPYCSTKSSSEGRYVRHNIRSVSEGSPRRYAMLTADTTDRQRDSMMEAFNSYENRHGEYISMIIVSGVGRDGINLSNVEHVFLVGGDWNESKMYQAESRAIRATSHEDLLNEERERLIAAGQDPSTATYIIKKYRLAAIAELDDQVDSIDLQMYAVAEAKSRQIHRVERMIKRVAIGCEINYARNVRSTDRDFSPECDYDVCEYQCFDREYVNDDTTEDFSTYDATYSHALLTRVIEDITQLFRYNDVLSRREVIDKLTQYRDTQITRGLEKIVNGKMSLMDRYGYTAYLIEDGDIFFLTRVYPSENTQRQLIDSYYSNKLIALSETQISQIGDIVERSEVGSVIEYLRSLSIEDALRSMFNLSVEMQAMVLEDALIRHYEYITQFYPSPSIEELEMEDDDPYVNAVLERYRRMIFYIQEPSEELQKLRDEQLSGKKRSAAKTKVRTYREEELDKFIREQELHPLRIDTPVQVLHILYSQAVDRTKYSITTRFNRADGRLRLLVDPNNSNMATSSDDDLHFRDLSNFEIPTYNRLIQMENRKRVKPLEDRGIYAFYGIDDKFRIRYKIAENQTGDQVNRRRTRRGKECETYERYDLIDIMWELGFGDENVSLDRQDREEMINYLTTVPGEYDSVMKTVYPRSRQELKSWSDSRILFYVQGWNDGTTRAEICEALEENMNAQGLIA